MFSKNTKFGAGRNWKSPICEEFKNKIKLLSTLNLLCPKFAGICEKIANPFFVQSELSEKGS